MTSSAPIIRYEYDGSETPSEAVITAVAAKTNRDPLEMDPLYETIDPDALDAFFRPRADRDTNASTPRIELCYGGEQVVVQTGQVQIYDTDDAKSDESMVNTHELQE